MHQRYVFSILFVCLALVICLTSLQAQMPPVAAPPIVLKASVSNDVGKVQLNWDTRDSIKSYYAIYRATFKGVSIYNVIFPDSLFVKIDSVPNTKREYIDVPPRLSTVSAYAYYVRGTTNKNVLDVSNVVAVMISPPVTRDIVQITSAPNEVGLVNVQYQYQLKAVSSDPTAVLRYFLNVKPTGMTIDTITGLIKWTPSVQGFVTVETGAKSNKGGMATQRYTVRVAGGSGIVVGTVTDTTPSSKPISQVVIHLYKLELSLVMAGASSSYDYKAVSDSVGKFKFGDVDPGTYYVRAEPTNSNYLAQWYDNQSSLQFAKPITVSDKATTEVNIKLRMRVKPVTYAIKGLVVDIVNPGPVKDATVSFVVAGFALNGNRGFAADPTNGQDFKGMFDMNPSSDFRLDGTNTQFVFNTKTDANGQFSLQLPAGSYIAYAEAKGYTKLFYNQKTNLLTADTIKVKTDMSDFRFPLTPVPTHVALGEINGVISDSTSGKGVRSRIIAFREMWVVNSRLNPGTDPYTPGSYMVDTDSLGKYSIVNMVPGNYYVLAMPVGNYTPAFYNASGGTQYWNKAQPVPISGNVAAGIDIKVKPLSKPIAGYTYVSGSVSTGSGSGKLGKTSGSIGLMGAIVYAVNSSGEIYGYDVTNENGSYAITGIAPGTYSLFVDAPGYTSTQSLSASPTYAADGKGTPQPGFSPNFTLTVTSVEETQPLVPSGYVLEQNYPNPFNPTTQILFSLPNSERVTLAIYNLLGQRMAELVNGIMSAGSHVVTWNGRDSRGLQLPSGVYFYRLESPSFTAAKRMLMLK